MQRAVYIAVAAFAALALITVRKPIIHKIFAVFGVITAIAGAAIAARQVWLQHLPADEVPACGPPLEYMIDVFPLMEVLQSMLMGTGSCAEIQWQLFGLSIPGWSIVAFSGLAIANIALIVKKK